MFVRTAQRRILFQLPVAALALWIALTLSVMSVLPALAQGSVRTADSNPAWQASYWNNMGLAGAPALQRSEAELNHDWGYGSPHPSVQADHFSARWTRDLDVGAGLYRFSLTVDDGARLWVNNHLLIDAWVVQAARTYVGDIHLPDGRIPIQLEYFENDGVALAKLSWSRVSPEGVQQWRGEYFNNPDLAGSPALVRNDERIDFDWGTGSPAPGTIHADNFSVRWTRPLRFEAGRYRFTTETDDGVRLYINDRLVIDQWREMPETRFTYETRLSAGVHTIRMEYFERSGRAVARLSWSRRTEEALPVGNIITCAPPQPEHCAWIKVYRREGDGSWLSMTPKGIGSICSTGYLKIDGLPVDTARYGGSGHPYWVELWYEGALMESVGNTDRGEPEFRVYPFQDNYTPWQCPPP